MCWKFAAICIMAHLANQVRADLDYMALLSETLETHHRLECTRYLETGSIALQCPQGTTIRITQAHYTDSPDMLSQTSCLYPVTEKHNDLMVRNCSNVVKMLEQYSLLQTVVENCQNKGQCEVTRSQILKDGSCTDYLFREGPLFIELAYKCGPFEFRSIVGCDKENITLSCNPGSRVAVYSAAYGRIKYQDFRCPQPREVPQETCIIESGTKSLQEVCHGRKSCNITVTPELFVRSKDKNPCEHDNTKPYLTVAYTCEGAAGHAPQDRDEHESMFYVLAGVCSGILVALGMILAKLVFHQFQGRRNRHRELHASRTKYQDDITAIEANLDLTSTSTIQKKRNVPHVVEDTILNRRDSQYPSKPTGSPGGFHETSLACTESRSNPMRGQSFYEPA
ncbi:protein eva-1 homolog C isoform X2 [Cephus cinctus]|uniref:Protein eva-1 homolog C isoform X2 n=1 Tax=Cephus cinctus TaxID=211228 RepID=A0AAJ7RNP4_CEPCN|nr:protein eva-1 homolog C isoform X2 [Cephus cinctus]